MRAHPAIGTATLPTVRSSEMPLLAGKSEIGHKSIAEIAYCAGILDGEGSISASKSTGCSLNFRVIVSVSMCDAEPLHLFVKLFGGCVKTTKTPTRTGKPIFYWAIFCRNAADVLETLLPYLLVKRQRAINAIQLARSMKTRGTASHHDFTDLEVANRQKLATAIRSENFSTNGRLASRATKVRLQ